VAKKHRKNTSVNQKEMILGLSAGFHDAAASIIDTNGDIVFAAHSERYSKKKNDADVDALLQIELKKWNYHTVAFYERPWLHNLQQLISGQRNLGPWTVSGTVRCPPSQSILPSSQSCRGRIPDLAVRSCCSGGDRCHRGT
jgi:hypothetical protein